MFGKFFTFHRLGDFTSAYTVHYRYVSIAFGICAMICAILLPNTAKFQTNRIAVELS